MRSMLGQMAKAFTTSCDMEELDRRWGGLSSLRAWRWGGLYSRREGLPTDPLHHRALPITWHHLLCEAGWQMKGSAQQLHLAVGS